MALKPFRIERFYAQYEFTTRYMLSSSDCESRTVADLLALEPGAAESLQNTWLGYTESAGDPDLRAAIAGLYDGIEPDDVIVVSAAEEGILLVYQALLSAGDRVVVEAPFYESAGEIPRAAGADVAHWQRHYQDSWAHDVDALRTLLPGAKLLYVNQPHNPTGTLMDRTTFDAVVAAAREHGTVIFGDEVYRGLEYDRVAQLPAACEVGGISLGSISKAYGLPGLRLGWLVTRDAAIRAEIMRVKDYTTICAPAPSELLTAIAIRNSAVLIDRSREIVAAGLTAVDEFLARRADLFDWVRPTGGPIGFPQVKGIADVDAWCADLAERAGVLVLPGSVYDAPAHVRLGFGRANLPRALAALDEALP